MVVLGVSGFTSVPRRVFFAPALLAGGMAVVGGVGGDKIQMGNVYVEENGAEDLEGCGCFVLFFI